jgi:hypothetical protein
MRIPFPIEIPIVPALLFFVAFATVQILEGTDPLFALYMLIAQIFGILAFNALGGMSHVSGSICLLSLLQNVTVPEIAHALVLQSGDYYLPSSLKTAAVIMAFYLCVYLAARFAMTFSYSEPIFDRIPFASEELRVLIWVAPILNCLFLVWYISAHGVVEDGSLLAIVQRFAHLLNPLSVILATYLILRRTGGKLGIDFTVALMVVSAILPGILTASKEGMLLPIFCWLMVNAAYGHRFTKAQILGLTGFVAFFVLVIYPYSQFARVSVRTSVSLTDKVNAIENYAKNPAAYAPTEARLEKIQPEFGSSVFGNSIVARYSLLFTEAEVIDFDRTGEFTGIGPYIPVFYGVIPHFLWQNHPVMISGNEIAHKAGFGPGPSDYTTGITIGAPALFFDVSGWPGLFILAVPEYALFFFITRCLVGKASQSIWCLVLIGMTANDAGDVGPGEIFGNLLNIGYLFFLIIVVLKIFSWSASAFLPKKMA